MIIENNQTQLTRKLLSLVIILLRANEKIQKRQPLTRNIAKKGIFGMHSSSPASISLYLDSDVLRIPFQAILPTLPASLIKTQQDRQLA